MKILRNPLVVVVILLVAGAVAWGAWRWRGSNNENFPGGTWWVCSGKECGHEFNLSLRALSDHHAAHYGEPVPCPKCKSPAVRAERCAACGKVYRIVPRPPDKCPHCGAAPAPPD